MLDFPIYPLVMASASQETFREQLLSLLHSIPHFNVRYAIFSSFNSQVANFVIEFGQSDCALKSHMELKVRRSLKPNQSK